jgi:hypothetical protein
MRCDTYLLTDGAAMTSISGLCSGEIVKYRSARGCGCVSAYTCDITGL